MTRGQRTLCGQLVPTQPDDLVHLPLGGITQHRDPTLEQRDPDFAAEPFNRKLGPGCDHHVSPAAYGERAQRILCDLEARTALLKDDVAALRAKGDRDHAVGVE